MGKDRINMKIYNDADSYKDKNLCNCCCDFCGGCNCRHCCQGNLKVTMTYELTDDNSFVITHEVLS